MKRLLALGVLIVLVAAAFAQSSGQATLRTPTATHPVTYVEQSGQVYLSAEEVLAGLGAIVPPRPASTSSADKYT